MSDDPRLNLLIKEGVDGEVVVVGYPYEEAARRCARKAGQENGPCCVRRFWGKVGPLVNAEYGLDISKLRVTDMGNIEADGLTVEEGVKKLSSRLDKYLSNKQFPIVIGGSKQTTLGSTLSFLSSYPKGRLLYLFGHPCMRRPFDHNKLTSLSLLHILTPQQRSKVVLVGSSEKYVQNSKERLEVTRIDREEIRKEKVEEVGKDVMDVRTQLGRVLGRVMQGEGQWMVAVSVEVLQLFEGTTLKQHGSITSEEILEAMLMFGRNPRVKIIDITEFNPSVEDYNSSLLILNMIYYYLLGFASK